MTPRAASLVEVCFEKLYGITPHLKVRPEGQPNKAVVIRGTLDVLNGWSEREFFSSRYFVVYLRPNHNGPYQYGDHLVLDLLCASSTVLNPLLPRFTGTPTNVASRLKQWVEDNNKQGD